MGTNMVGEGKKDPLEGAGIEEGQVGRPDPLGVSSSGATSDLGPTDEELPLSDSELRDVMVEIEAELPKESTQKDLGADEVSGVEAVNPLAMDADGDGFIDGDDEDEVSGGMDSDGVEFSAEDLSEEEIQPGEFGEGTADLIAEAGQSEENAGTPPPDAFAEAQERFDKAGQKRTKAWKKKHDVRLNKLGYNAACNEYDAACEEYNEARRAYDAAIQKRNEEEELQQAVTGAAGVGKGQAEKGGVGWERIVVSKREKVDGQSGGTGDQGHPVQKRRIPIKEGRPNLTQEPLNTVFSGGGGVMSRLGRNKFWLKILVFLGIGGAAAGVAYEVMQRRLAHQEVVDTLDAKEEANRAGFDADMQMLQDSIAAQKKELGVK